MSYGNGLEPLVECTFKLKRAQLLGIVLHKEYVYLADYFIVINDLSPEHSPDDTKEQRAAIFEKELRCDFRVMGDEGGYYFLVGHDLYFIVLLHTPSKTSALLSLHFRISGISLHSLLYQCFRPLWLGCRMLFLLSPSP